MATTLVQLVESQAGHLDQSRSHLETLISRTEKLEQHLDHVIEGIPKVLRDVDTVATRSVMAIDVLVPKISRDVQKITNLLIVVLTLVAVLVAIIILYYLVRIYQQGKRPAI